MTLTEAKQEAVRLANESGKLYSVVVSKGAEVGLLGNNKECEVVPYPPESDRVVMGDYGPGARL